MTLRKVSGRVVDLSGAPVAGARVSIVESPVPMPEMAMLADAAGRFALHLPAGRFGLRADGEGGARGTAAVDTGRDRDVTIRIARPAARGRSPPAR